MEYRSVVATRRSGPEALRVVENQLRPAAPGEARVRVLATPVCLPDVQNRYGQSPFAPSVPFVPGYGIVGVVDALGDGVTNTAVGDRVGALTAFGGYAECIYVRQGSLFPVPVTVDPAQAATLVLNYIVAYQTMHRSAKVKAGDKVLIVGASGGIGTALLQLGQLADLTMYGLASEGKHGILKEYGATPIDYHTEDFVQVMRHLEPDGLDVVFDGVGGDYIDRGLAVLGRGGRLVAYGNPLSRPGLLRLLAKTLMTNLLPNGKTIRLYGTSASRWSRRVILEDWATLFRLLKAGKIRPIIAAKLPLLEAARGNALLESGQVIGNVVLVAPELM